MNRRSALKALCAIPIGIALIRFTDSATQRVAELWSGHRLILVRPIPVADGYMTLDVALSEDERHAITDWSNLTVRIVSNGPLPPLEGSVALTAPAPARLS